MRTLLLSLSVTLAAAAAPAPPHRPVVLTRERLAGEWELLWDGTPFRTRFWDDGRCATGPGYQGVFHVQGDRLVVEEFNGGRPGTVMGWAATAGRPTAGGKLVPLTVTRVYLDEPGLPRSDNTRVPFPATLKRR